MSEIIAIVGLITGLSSLILILYRIGSRDGKVDTKIDTLWSIYVLDALSNETKLAQHHSPPAITPEGEAEIPDDLKKCITSHVCKSKNFGMEIVECLGIDKIQAFAQSKNWTMQKTIGILSLYLKKVIGECDGK